MQSGSISSLGHRLQLHSQALLPKSKWWPTIVAAKRHFPLKRVWTFSVYLVAVLPHTNGDVVCTVPRLILHYSSRKECSGCQPGVSKLQILARSSSCGPNLFQNAAPVSLPATAIFGKIAMTCWMISPQLTIPSIPTLTNF